MRALGLNTGSGFHLLDHIAPLCSLWNIPLAVTEEENFKLAKKFYPRQKLLYLPDVEAKLGQLAEACDTLIECQYFAPHLKRLFEDLYQKKMELIFCPHGQSDKGFQFPTLAPYAAQDKVLIYGELLLEMLKKLNIQVPPFEFVGNYRLKFYKQNQAFYDSLAETMVPIDKRKKTILYAPTWKDADETESFFFYAEKILKELPQDWNLILKVHPLLEARTPVRYYRTLKDLEKKKNVYLVDQFPAVYPILNLADLYLGDFSSVNYDFLYFERPMFFLPTKTPTRIYCCGKMLSSDENFFKQFESPLDLKKEQQKLYQKAFFHSKDGRIKTDSKSLKLDETGFTSIS